MLRSQQRFYQQASSAQNSNSVVAFISTVSRW
jgi:hypothetical protein